MQQMARLTEEQRASLETYRTRFIEAMDDDLNTADALSVIFDLVREINTNVQSSKAQTKGYVNAASDLFEELTSVLGLLYQKKEEPIPQEILDLVQARTEARKAKDFALADQLRDEIAQRGYVVEETRKGTRISKKG